MTGGPGLDLARAHVDAVLAEAAVMRLRVAVAVVDLGGHPVATARMDGVAFLNGDVARRKAVAALTFGVPTQDLRTALGDPLVRAALAATATDALVVPGGFPITRVVTTVGALGVAGGHHAQDHELGERALARLVG